MSLNSISSIAVIGRLGSTGPPLEPEQTAAMVADFRQLMVDHDHQESAASGARRAAAEQRRLKVMKPIDHHISDENWRGLMHQARRVAERAAKRVVAAPLSEPVVRGCRPRGQFGRTQLAGVIAWEASEIYIRWQRDVRPHGFRLGARVLEFPGGMPGDIGLFLTWVQ